MIEDTHYTQQQVKLEDNRYKKIAQTIVSALWDNADNSVTRLSVVGRPKGRALGSKKFLESLFSKDAKGSASDPVFDKLLKQERGLRLLRTISDLMFGLNRAVVVTPEPFLADDYFRKGSELLLKVGFVPIARTRPLCFTTLFLRLPLFFYYHLSFSPLPVSPPLRRTMCRFASLCEPWQLPRR